MERRVGAKGGVLRREGEGRMGGEMCRWMSRGEGNRVGRVRGEVRKGTSEYGSVPLFPLGVHKLMYLFLKWLEFCDICFFLYYLNIFYVSTYAKIRSSKLRRILISFLGSLVMYIDDGFP